MHRPLAVILLLAASTALAADPPAPAAAEPATKLSDLKRWVIASSFTKDGGLLLTAGGESLLYRPGDVVVWKTADGSRVGDMAGHPTAVWAVQVSADGKLAATAGYDGLVKLWDLPARASSRDLARSADGKDGRKTGWVRSLAFSPDGARLAAACEDGGVTIWDTAAGSEVKTIAAHTGAATCVVFSPDGATLASGGSDKLVKLWNAASGEERGKLEGHGDALWALAYSPDGSRLASAGADRSIRLWTTSDSKPEATLAGHKDWVTSLAFFPDGTRLASGSLDGVVKLWDVAAKGEQAGPEPLKSSVWTVAVPPDAKTIFVGTHAGPRVVPTPAAKLLPPPPPPPPTPTPPPSPTPPAAAPAAKPAATSAPAGAITLTPREFTSMAGAKAAIAADGALLVTGPLSKDTYTVRTQVPAGGAARAIRLEVLPDPSLPAKGPGRSGSGNFVLSTFAVLAGQPGGNDTPTPVKFKSAKADYEQAKYPATAAIDDMPATGWAIGGGGGAEHAVTFEIAAEAPLAAGTPLTITLDQQYEDGQHAIGRFRLSVLADPASGAKKP